MVQLDTVLLKVASRCNLDCTYCYVYQGEDTGWKNQPKRMSKPTIEKVIDSLSSFSKTQAAGFAVVLHGGEPLLLDIDRLTHLFSGLRAALYAKKYPISIQTNGVLMTEEILNLCSKYSVSLSVSIDGPKGTNDIARVDHKGNSSFAQTLRGIEMLKAHKDSAFLFAGTLTVIQPSTPPLKTYAFLKALASPNIDFLFQDGNHNRLPKGKSTFDSTEYGLWLVEILKVYLKDDHPVPIRILDDLIKTVLGGNASKEGKGEAQFGILIIETDGEIRKNDTLRASYDGADYFEGRPTLASTSIKAVVSSDEFRHYTKIQIPTAQACQDCEYLAVCGGGMPLYRWRSDNGFNNPSVFCKDHSLIIKNIYELLYSHGLAA